MPFSYFFATASGEEKNAHMYLMSVLDSFFRVSVFFLRHNIFCFIVLACRITVHHRNGASTSGCLRDEREVYVCCPLCHPPPKYIRSRLVLRHTSRIALVTTPFTGNVCAPCGLQGKSRAPAASKVLVVMVVRAVALPAYTTLPTTTTTCPRPSSPPPLNCDDRSRCKRAISPLEMAMLTLNMV